MPTVVLDEFTGTVGTALVDHTSDNGVGWAYLVDENWGSTAAGSPELTGAGELDLQNPVVEWPLLSPQRFIPDEHDVSIDFSVGDITDMTGSGYSRIALAFARHDVGTGAFEYIDVTGLFAEGGGTWNFRLWYTHGWFDGADWGDDGLQQELAVLSGSSPAPPTGFSGVLKFIWGATEVEVYRNTVLKQTYTRAGSPHGGIGSASFGAWPADQTSVPGTTYDSVLYEAELSELGTTGDIDAAFPAKAAALLGYEGDIALFSVLPAKTATLTGLAGTLGTISGSLPAKTLSAQAQAGTVGHVAASLPAKAFASWQIYSVEAELTIAYRCVAAAELTLVSEFLDRVQDELVLIVPYVQRVENEFVVSHPVLATDRIEAELVVVYFNGSTATITVLNSVQAMISGKAVPLDDVSIDIDEGQYAWTCNITLVDPEHAALFERDTPFTVDLAGETYAFLVEGRDYARTSVVESSATVSGISPSAVYDAPRCAQITKTWATATSVLAVVEELFGVGTVEWEILNWTLPANRLAVKETAPIGVLQKLAQAAGAIVESDPDGTLRVHYAYPTAVPAYGSATPDYAYNSAEHNLSMREQRAAIDIVNKLRILDVAYGTSDRVDFTQNDEFPDRGVLRVWPTPWREDLTVEHTSRPTVSVRAVGVTVEELTETVEVISGKGSVAYPIFEVSDVEWLYDDLTAITFELGSTEFSTTSATATETLVRITYTTRYLKFETAAFVDAEVQYLVKETA